VVVRLGLLWVGRVDRVGALPREGAPAAILLEEELLDEELLEEELLDLELLEELADDELLEADELLEEDLHVFPGLPGGPVCVWFLSPHPFPGRVPPPPPELDRCFAIAIVPWLAVTPPTAKKAASMARARSPDKPIWMPIFAL
jgi:hypothetical protein